MVTKHVAYTNQLPYCLILAKNHMVTKHVHNYKKRSQGLILAKNHMVTKQHLHIIL